MTSPVSGPRSPTLVPVANLDELRDTWSALAPLTGNVFSTWEWASAWWREYGHDRRLAVSVVHGGDGRVAAVVPLYEWSERPFRIVRFLGHGPADQLGLVCAPSDHGVAGEAMRRAVEVAGFDLALAELVPGGAGWEEVLGSRVLVRESSPTLLLGRSWEGVLSERSANFRQQVRRRERRLRKRYSVRFRLASDRERLEDDFSQFVALHRARWGRSSAFGRWERFLRGFVAVAFQRDWLRLWFLELDGVAVAAWLGFRFADVESYYQAGRDPRHDDESVGFVLLVHSIREAAADGLSEYRFLRGGEVYKGRFADGDPGVETHALVHGLRGRVAAGLASAGLRSAGARALFRSIGGKSGPSERAV